MQQSQQQQQQPQQQQHFSSSSSSSSGCSSDGYVCVLDDDVALHPLSLCQLVDEMQADPQLFMATGFPFDIVAPASSSKAGGGWLGRLLAHAAASYHLPLLIGFSVADRGGFVWGGAMLLRAAELRTAAAAAGDAAGSGTAAAAKATAAAAGKGATGSSAEATPSILQVWRHGGYSDDLLLAAYCTEHRLPIGMPASATFPQQLPPTYTPKQYWNYLRRQLYVLDTYHSRHNRALNHSMMLAHSYASAVFTAAVLTSSLQLLLLLVTAAVLLLQHVLPWSATVSGRGTWAVMWSDSSGSSGNSSESSLLAVQQLLANCTSLSTWVFVGLTASSLAAVQFVIQQVLQLFKVLSPGAGDEVLHPHISLPLLWLGWVLENAVLPLCMLYSFCCNHIVWGGITYHKQGGRIRKVVHPHVQQQ
ncbi:hypothetical protein COO60DRAFT_709067 [Scenedesmus sp. NREL 46B-D3]|nr:hypothetical protein COO60DRAFT_709067 [Scenedesmus sp. NREL 46B-D3]